MKFDIEKIKSYTIMPNTHLQDRNLSLKAKGLLSVMYNLPNDWDYTLKGLCTITNTGITSIRNIITELEITGYITRIEYKDKKGKFNYNYIVRLTPKKINPTDNCIALKRFKTKLNKVSRI